LRYRFGICFLLVRVSFSNFKVYQAYADNWKGFKKQNVYTDEALKLWLGDESRLGQGPSGTLVGNFAKKKDPLCRFM
jgi:hypothetical protein